MKKVATGCGGCLVLVLIIMGIGLASNLLSISNPNKNNVSPKDSESKSFKEMTPDEWQAKRSQEIIDQKAKKERQAEEAKLAEEQRIKEAEIAEQKRTHDEEIAKQQRLEAQKIAEQKKAADIKLANDYHKLVIETFGEDIKESISKIEVGEKMLTLTVSNDWHFSPYQIRLQAAQNLWKLWASIASPDAPDLARLDIVDLNGNTVGGSRFLAGSLIWVQEK